ncbi:MAG: peptidase E [archaeon]
MKIVAIGGGEISLGETGRIEREIVRLSGKRAPRLLFIPTASGDSPGYCNAVEARFSKLGCMVAHLRLCSDDRDRAKIKRKILSSDIIYVGGGNTLRMLRLWKRFGVGELLRTAGGRGTVLSGISAGALCWARFGTSDSRRFWTKPSQKAMRVKGLGFLPFGISPHHFRERAWRERAAGKLVRKAEFVVGIEDCAALETVDGRNFSVLSAKRGRGAWVFSRGQSGRLLKVYAGSGFSLI